MVSSHIFLLGSCSRPPVLYPQLSLYPQLCPVQFQVKLWKIHTYLLTSAVNTKPAVCVPAVPWQQCDPSLHTEDRCFSHRRAQLVWREQGTVSSPNASAICKGFKSCLGLSLFTQGMLLNGPGLL